ncbi:MAG: hypothetical protein GW772_08595 [Flavobacteriia bacterium]|nr:hypothetical protein [Flavobacteriia bacterium]OIP47662.1 MAG: hypothetical protein AUK46_03925 [Flavobacteriaceae bacterium CG2_30_31_66]PIV97353.1 MAG: hypothetical protein COW43_02895 [Flavobacteriaceae bacterium CG17_big_fil_post_rev_8_21_14_2_50_31_13]PIX13321.1 MAG: hypothetical protein COZ74_06895 [Flavobacteriaceae bacterium CG_4_8_14_3_um_filter_31_8]PIY14710.1 MAG: hypothetical protein COZ16_07135 [Flavobacteriaceae bacterium CG_4_10_14_3_um_filter_31_253]PIZ12060.1 MAG: hypotheti
MKKDIHIPEVTDVAIAIVFEYNDIYKTDDWNAYIINKKSVDLELVVIVSQGFSETKTTSLFRKKLDVLPANSFAKIELIQPELFQLNNRFQVSFFEGNTLFEKTFLFKENTIKEGALRIIPEMGKRGILAYD